jgi:hypothetical protein
MSMDLYVFIDHSAPLTVVEWQQAIDAKQLPIHLKGDGAVAAQSGFFPVSLDGRSTGFYFAVADARELASAYPQIGVANVDHRTAFSLSFAQLSECASLYYSAAALVASFNGRAFDPQQGKFLDYGELRQAGEQCGKLARKQP